MRRVLATILAVATLLVAGCSGAAPAKPAQDAKTPNSSGPAPTTAGQPKRGGVLKVALVSDITSADMLWTTANVTLHTLAHVYEYLFTLDQDYNFVPMLAEKMDVSDGGKTFTIRLRQNVPFHNGKEMTAEDVIASLQRWQRISSRAKVLLKELDGITSPDKYTVVVKFKSPNGAFLSALSIPNQQMVVMPKEMIEKNRDSTGKDLQIKDKDAIGTGPYVLAEWVPDRYVKLKRFDKYAARSEPTSGLGGRRQANVDEIQFIPVPDDATRLAGLISGEYHIAYTLAPALYDQVKSSPDLVPQIVKPGSGAVAVFNKKQGPFTNVKLRQAALAATDAAKVMAGAVDRQEFSRLGPWLAGPEWAFWHNKAGENIYGKRDLAKAKQLLAEAGYKGEKIRWITTKDYDYMYRTALVASEQMKEAGFNVELVVSDWPTVIANRAKPEAYEIFSTGIGFTGDPTGTAAFTPDWPGWNSSPRNAENYNNLIRETDPNKRKQLFVEQQTIFWEEVPYMQFGELLAFRAHRKEVKGLWDKNEFSVLNVWLDK